MFNKSLLTIGFELGSSGYWMRPRSQLCCPNSLSLFLLLILSSIPSFFTVTLTSLLYVDLSQLSLSLSFSFSLSLIFLLSFSHFPSLFLPFSFSLSLIFLLSIAIFLSSLSLSYLLSLFSLLSVRHAFEPLCLMCEKRKRGRQ